MNKSGDEQEETLGRAGFIWGDPSADGCWVEAEVGKDTKNIIHLIILGYWRYKHTIHGVVSLKYFVSPHNLCFHFSSF